MNLIVSYFGFLIRPDFIGDYHSDILWFYFWAGFEKPESNLLIKNCYGYWLLLLFLVIERHCLEYMLFEKVLLTDEEKKQEKKSRPLLKFLNFLRVFAEALVPMFVLEIAFSKLTFVSVIYVIGVFVSILLGTTFTRTKFLNHLLLFMSLIQYALILSNLSNENSPETLPVEKSPINIPWYTHKEWDNPDTPVFFGLGTNLSQLHSLLWDLLALQFLFVYYCFLSIKEFELDTLTEGEEEIVDIEKSLIGSVISSKDSMETGNKGLESIEEAKEERLEDSHLSSGSDSSAGSVEKILKASLPQRKQYSGISPLLEGSDLDESLGRKGTKSNIQTNRYSDVEKQRLTEIFGNKDEKPKKVKFNKEILLKIKSAVYNASHFLILPIVLLFISQSHGLISGVYCLFCLIFIYKSNEIIKSEKS